MIRRDCVELWQGLVLQDMGEVDLHVFWKYWKLTSSPNTSKLILGPPDRSSDFFKARVPSQELSNKLIFQTNIPKTKYFLGNWTISQNLHFLFKGVLHVHTFGHSLAVLGGPKKRQMKRKPLYQQMTVLGGCPVFRFFCFVGVICLETQII